MLIARIRVNPRYIKPKYGSGIFSSFIKFISKAASRVAKNRTINDAIAGGKQVLNKVAVSGKELAKEAIEKGYLKKPLEAAINFGAEQVANQLNKGIKSSTNFAKSKLDKTLTNHPAIHNLANTFVDSLGNKAKEIGEQSVNRISKDLIQRTGGKRKREASQQRTAKKIKKKKKSTKQKTIDWGDLDLNTLIAKS